MRQMSPAYYTRDIAAADVAAVGALLLPCFRRCCRAMLLRYMLLAIICTTTYATRRHAAMLRHTLLLIRHCHRYQRHAHHVTGHGLPTPPIDMLACHDVVVSLCRLF